MNRTQYLPERSNSFMYHARRNSLDQLNRIKLNTSTQKQDPFRRSCSSFNGMAKRQKEELPQIGFQKQASNNIYFNPHCRANYFKNLIDSYFDTKKDSDKHSKFTEKSVKRTHLLRKSILNTKAKQLAGQIREKMDQHNKIQKRIERQNKAQKKEAKTQLQQMTTEHSIKKPQTKQYSIRYKQQRAKIQATQNRQTQSKDKVNQYQGSFEKNQRNVSSPQSFMDYQLQGFFEPSFLPKITEAVDDGNQDQDQSLSKIQLLTTTDNFMRSQSSFSKLQGQKRLIYQNSILKIYQSIQNQKKYRIKQFKTQIFLYRHKRAIELGCSSFWSPYKFNQLSLITPSIYPLKDLLYRLLPHPTSPQLYHIQPKPLYSKLTANNCQQLVMLFRQLMKDLARTQSKVINNKINLSNLFLVNGKVVVGDWQYAAFKKGSQIQGNYFQARVEPILKCEKEWLLSPEYLAPEVLQSILNPQMEFDLWKYGNVSDVYSIGLAFLEIVTLIPVWMQFRTLVKTRTMKPRDGLLWTSNRSTARILQKQRTLQSRMSTIIQRQVPQTQKNNKFFQLLIKMIQPQPQKRLRMQQIIQEAQ